MLPVSIPTFNAIDRHNLTALHLLIKLSLSKADFLSFDTEFTGLGKHQLARAQNIEDRYKYLASHVSSHSVVSLGLSIFQKKNQPQQEIDVGFNVNNFNFLLLKDADFMISPSSMEFLVEHGFDCNKLFRDGIFYHAGDELVAPKRKVGKEHSNYLKIKPLNDIMRSIFVEIIAKKVPIVIHNGLLDLMFIYHSFYAELPSDIHTFISDLSQMFPAGIYDTKYTSDYIEREQSSFLAYLFRKYEREQMEFQLANKSPFILCNVQPRFKSPPLPTNPNGAMGEQIDLSKKRNAAEIDAKPYCEKYANHGYCDDGKNCVLSHDLDVILDHQFGQSEVSKKSKKKKQKKSEEKLKTSNDNLELETPIAIKEVSQKTLKAGPSNVSAIIKSQRTKIIAQVETPSKIFNPEEEAGIVLASSDVFESYHSAYFDAFMTAFIFARQRLKYGKEFLNHGNKLYLMAKDVPLRVEKSAYARYSVGHKKRWEDMRSKGYVQ